MRPGHVVISGASRGIGQALALAYAAPGAALLLIGRDADRLEEVGRECRARGAEATIACLDVRDAVALRAALLAADGHRPVDLVIANAGVALPTKGDEAVLAAAHGEIDINLRGAVDTISPLIPAMSGRGRGQLAVVSSLAAFAPLPDSPGYSATKAALLVYGLALRERLRQRGVRVSVICPGYVETEMGSRYRGWRPFLMSAEDAARRIVVGLECDRPVIAFPRRLAWIARLSTFVPEGVRRLGLSGFRFSIDVQERPPRQDTPS